MTVQRMCELGQVSRSGFYRIDPDREREDRDMELRDAIQRIALEFPCYGRPRISAGAEPARLAGEPQAGRPDHARG